jgi:hypothetical protein
MKRKMKGAMLGLTLDVESAHQIMKEELGDAPVNFVQVTKQKPVESQIEEERLMSGGESDWQQVERPGAGEVQRECDVKMKETRYTGRTDEQKTSERKLCPAPEPLLIVKAAESHLGGDLTQVTENLFLSSENIQLF